MNKTVIAPIIGFLALTLEWLFNINIGEELQGQIADFIINGVALGAVLYGIIKNHKDIVIEEKTEPLP